VSELEQQLRHAPPSVGVVRQNGVHRSRVRVTIEEDNGEVLLGTARQGLSEHRGQVDDTIDGAAADQVFDAVSALPVHLLVEQDRPVVGHGELVVQDLDQLRVEGIRDARHHNRDRPRAARDQAARRDIRCVAETLRGLEDARDRGRRHSWVASQRARHGRLTHTQLTSEVLARRGHRARMPDRRATRA
jgi:hypothetical protein